MQQPSRHEPARVEEEAQDAGEAVETSEGKELLDLILVNHAPERRMPTSVIVGRLMGVTPPTVVFAERPEGVAARTVVPLRRAEIGREVTLQFENGSWDKPIVAGVLQDSEPLAVEVDGKAMVVEGNQRIALKCGKASITLTRAGKVIIKGAYVSTHATGVNRIKGGSVQIN